MNVEAAATTATNSMTRETVSYREPISQPTASNTAASAASRGSRTCHSISGPACGSAASDPEHASDTIRLLYNRAHDRRGEHAATVGEAIHHQAAVPARRHHAGDFEL